MLCALSQFLDRNAHVVESISNLDVPATHNRPTNPFSSPGGNYSFVAPGSRTDEDVIPSTSTENKTLTNIVERDATKFTWSRSRNKLLGLSTIRARARILRSKSFPTNHQSATSFSDNCAMYSCDDHEGSGAKKSRATSGVEDHVLPPTMSISQSSEDFATSDNSCTAKAAPGGQPSQSQTSPGGSFRRTHNRRHLPVASGPHTVGCVDLMCDLADQGTFFRLYYPTNPTDIHRAYKQWPLWLPRKQYAFGYIYFLKKNRTIFGRLANWLGGDIYVPVLWQAPLLRSEEKFPVVIVSHGIGGNRTTLSTYSYELASYGFVVAALEHRDGTASMTLCLTEQLTTSIIESDEAAIPTHTTADCSSNSSKSQHKYQHHSRHRSLDESILQPQKQRQKHNNQSDQETKQQHNQHHQQLHERPKTQSDQNENKENKHTMASPTSTNTKLSTSTANSCQKTTATPRVYFNIGKNDDQDSRNDSRFVTDTTCIGDSEVKSNLLSCESDIAQIRYRRNQDTLECDKSTASLSSLSNQQHQYKSHPDRSSCCETDTRSTEGSGGYWVRQRRKNRRRSLRHNHSCTEEWRPFQHVPVWDDFQYRNGQMYHRADEISDLLDELISVNDGSHINNALGLAFTTNQFKNRLDFSRVAIIGHSFGGAATLATLLTDARFKAGICLDTWMHPVDDYCYNNTRQPALFLNMEAFQWERNVNQMLRFQQARPDVDTPMMTMLGGCHQSMTDFQFIVPQVVGRIMDVCHTLSPAQCMSTVMAVTLAFLRKHLDLTPEPQDNSVLECQHPNLMVGTNVDLTVPDDGPTPP